MGVFTKRTAAPFRFDVVGSYLRPQELKSAREAFAAGTLSREALTAVEDTCIRSLAEKQKEAGLQAITDGEFRRSWWHLDFMWGLQGVEKVIPDSGYTFQGETTRAESAAVTGKISGENHPFVEHFQFLKSLETPGVTARQTIPAPAQLLAELQRNSGEKPTAEIYPEQDRLIADIAAAYQTVILDLYRAGCRNVQLDDCTWGMFCDSRYWESSRRGGTGPAETAQLYLKLNNLALQHLPEDLAVTTHVCRGNYHSAWASQGGYAPIAEPLFGEENVQGYYLEFDDDRSGDFAPLKHVSGEKLVVLGLVTSKSPVLEDKGSIIARIHEAAQYIPLDRLCLSPQCGFASTEEGNVLTEADQWNKIALIREIAREVWGE